MLSKTDFMDAVRRNIENFLPEDAAENVGLSETVVVKMNDQKLHGIIIREKGSDAAPTFYMDEMFERYSQGEDLGSLMVELANQYSTEKAGGFVNGVLGNLARALDEDGGAPAQA